MAEKAIIAGPSAAQAATGVAVVLEEMPTGSTHSLQLIGTFTGVTVNLEGTLDQKTWVQLNISSAAVGATVTSNAATTVGIYTVTLPVPLYGLRANVTAISTGSVSCAIASA